MGTEVISLIIGIIFGACLVLAGFTEPDRITRALRLKDTYIICTVIVIVLIALIGTWLIKMFGTVEVDNKPAAIVTLIIGGLLFGAGIGFTGYTPGTSLASAVSGKIDALFAILGMFFGAYIYIFLYPPVIQPLEKVFNYEKVTLPEITHIPDIVWIIFFSAAGSIVLFLSWAMRFSKKSTNAKSDKSAIKEELFDGQIPGLLTNEENLSIKTDYFYTTQMLRVWKNLFFCIILICMLLLQILFWLVSQGNKEDRTHILFGITPEQVTMILNISNTILIFAAVLYVLTIFFCLSCSFSTNLGGLRYISRAFFSALVSLVLLFPMQILFGPILFGVIYSPSELLKSNSENAGQLFTAFMLYLRFVGYWAFVMFLLIRSQVYSQKWTKSLLDRIEQLI